MTGPVDALLEREGELALLDSRATLFARGQGQAVLIAGPAGIGKTTLLAAALGRERKPGRAVLAARGGELETELPYGVVRQLFERLITTAAPGERAQMLAGAAGLAEPVFAGKTHATSGEAVMHGLFWMAANIATERPLVIAIDDAHWADAASLRFASYLVRRLEGLAVLVLLCARTDEPVVPGSELDQLVNEPTIERVDVRPLSNAGVRAVVEAVFECVPDSEFVAACTRATAGNPFLLRALAGDLRASGVQPTAQCVGLVGDVGPDIVGHGALLRLARLHPVATRLAQAVAVLGADARLPRVAKLADLPNEEALRAVDALVAGGIIELGPPLAFTHPIIRTSVYRGIGTGERSLAHTRAAEQLAEEGAAADVVATHLLATEPIGGTKAVHALREGASDALARGAPESAVAFLRRALAEEPPRAVRADLLFELGMAENKIRRADSIDQLLEARRLMDDPVARGRCSLALGNILIWMGRAKESYEALRAGIADTEGTGDAIAIRLKAAYVSHGMYFASEVDQVDRMLESLRPLLDAGSLPPDSQVLVAGVDVMRGRDVDAAVTTIRHAIDHGQLLSELGAESDVLTAGLVALAFSDEVDAAEALLEAMTIDARVRGSAAGFLTTCGLRECVLWRRGDVAGAEDELRRALTLVKEHSLSLPLVFALYYGVDAMTERDGLADVVELAMGLELPPFLAETVTAAWLAEIRARLLLAKSERRAAVQALRGCEAVYERIPLQPSASAWRSLLALASAPEDPKRARDLAHTELDAAERVGQPRAIGIALCRLGLIEGGQLGIERLREGEARLRHSTARLEHARALVELGGALRRANRRADARKPLHEGMDLAYRCGASRLAERARTELRATGARPRRVMVSGRDALTPSERRIADLAAGGLSNPDIAQSLFVTSKTVENQLSRVYRKLAIGSRAELAEALAGEGAERRSHP